MRLRSIVVLSLFVFLLSPISFLDAQTSLQPCIQIRNNLSPGARTAEVILLQRLLNRDPATRVSSSGPGSPGQETNYFGAGTRAAVIRYQEKFSQYILKPAGLSRGTGYFGPSTRTYMNANACTAITTTVTSNAIVSTRATTTTAIGPKSVTMEFDATAGQVLKIRVGAFYGNAALTYTTGPLPSKSSFSNSTLEFTWRPTSAQVGQHTLRFYARDAQNRTGTFIANIEVDPALPGVVTPTSTPSTETQTDQTEDTTTLPDKSELLEPLMAKLHGDDSADDSRTLQAIIDLANAEGINTITLPAGTFRIDKGLKVYGTDLTFEGQGESTILDVNANYDINTIGAAMLVTSDLDPVIYNPSEPVSGRTIQFNTAVPFTVGERLMLYNGKGGTLVVDHARGGDSDVNLFQERAPMEFVTVAALSNNRTTVTLKDNLIGTQDEYTNVLPAGRSASEKYLTVRRIAVPAKNITVRNFAVKFTNMLADVSMLFYYVDTFKVTNVRTLNQSQVGGYGGMSFVGSINGTVTNNRSVRTLGFNSTRRVTISNNTVLGISFEEAATDSVIKDNTVGAFGSVGGGLPFRFNDVACARNSILNNTIWGGGQDFGGMGIAGGYDTIIAYNKVVDTFSAIWLGYAPHTIIHDNTAKLFGSYHPSNLAPGAEYGNSWQQPSSFLQKIGSYIALASNSFTASVWQLLFGK